MGFTKSSCEEFVDVLASKAPVPGGGGASALVGAIGMALGNMVGKNMRMLRLISLRSKKKQPLCRQIFFVW